MDDHIVHIFWDQSNIFHCAQNTCDDKGVGKEPGHRFDLRLNFQALYDFAAMGRTVEKAVAIGSVPPPLQALWNTLRGTGAQLELQERGAVSNREQAVDEALQLHMVRSLVDRKPPAVAVVLTGDGGFKQDIDRLLDGGWGVEVLSFSCGFNKKLRAVAKGHGGRGRYVDLDGWYNALTYLQDVAGGITRPASALDLTTRPHV